MEVSQSSHRALKVWLKVLDSWLFLMDLRLAQIEIWMKLVKLNRAKRTSFELEVIVLVS